MAMLDAGAERIATVTAVQLQMDIQKNVRGVLL